MDQIRGGASAVARVLVESPEPIVAPALFPGARRPICSGMNADRATVPIEVHAPDDLPTSVRDEIRDQFWVAFDAFIQGRR